MLSPCHLSTISLTLELLGKCPHFLKSNCYFLVITLSVLQKLSTRAASVGINTSIELILCDPNLVSPLSGLKANHLSYFYGRPIATACILARKDISPMMLWQAGGKPEFGWKAGKVEASAGWGRTAWTGKRKGAALQDKGKKFGRAVKIPAQTCSRKDLSALDRVTANVDAILGWFSSLHYRK